MHEKNACVMNKLKLCILSFSLFLPLAGLAEQAQTPAPAALYEQAMKDLQAGKYAEAASQLEAQARLQPEDLNTLQALAEAYLGLNNLPVAEATLMAAHQLDRNAPRTHFLLGRLRFAQAEFEKARSHFRVLEYLKLADALLYYELARTLKALEQPEEALKTLQMGLQQRGSSQQTQAQLLLLQAELEPEQAGGLLETALALPELSAPVRQALQAAQVEHYLQQGQIRDLIEQQLKRLELALQADQQAQLPGLLQAPENWMIRADNADIERMFYQEQLLALYGRYPAANLLKQHLMRQFLKQERYEDLLAMHRQELLLKSSSWSDQEIGQAFHRMADIHLKMGYLQFAFDNYQRASERNPRNEEALKRMGVIYLSAGDKSGAIKLFGKVLETNPLERETRLFLALALAYDRKDEQVRTILAQLPEGFRADVQGQIQAVLVSNQRQPDKELWRRLIPEDQILSPLF